MPSKFKLKTLKIIVLSSHNHTPMPIVLVSSGMCSSMREDFSGIGMGFYRVDLVQRLDHVLEELDRELEYFRKDRLESYGDDL